MNGWTNDVWSENWWFEWEKLKNLGNGIQTLWTKTINFNFLRMQPVHHRSTLTRRDFFALSSPVTKNDANGEQGKGFIRKTKCCLTWTFGAIIFYELLLNNEMVRTDLYIQDLYQLDKVIYEKRSHRCYVLYISNMRKAAIHTLNWEFCRILHIGQAWQHWIYIFSDLSNNGLWRTGTISSSQNPKIFTAELSKNFSKVEELLQMTIKNTPLIKVNP